MGSIPWLWLILAWVAGTAALLLPQRRALLALWREPVLRRPVLILESDDWGAGGPPQDEALRELAGLLAGYRDRDGRPPVMTLGLVLGCPDGALYAADGGYHRLGLAAERFADLRRAIEDGSRAGVLAVQLHGGEHFWPPALLAAAARQDAVDAWLRAAPAAPTEGLPGHLQSRWVDASELPARPLPPAALAAAAAAEVAEARTLFGDQVQVAVPPTFVWDEAVERAWAQGGIQVVVTPGHRCRTRDGAGAPADRGPAIRNGERGPAGCLYLVRDAYFEPSRGHRAERALEALAERSALGRPTLLETHRANFLDPAARSAALEQVGQLLHGALARYPDLAFLSTARLARVYRDAEAPWLESAPARRLRVWLLRVEGLPRMRKLLWLTGLALVVRPLRRLLAAVGG